MLSIIYLPPEQLKPYEHNARIHTKESIEAIKDSIIKTGGFHDPIGIYGKDNLIVEGHGRRQAAIELGIKEVPCIRLDHMTDEQRRLYTLSHNKTSEMSGWAIDKLLKELDALHTDGVDLESSMFSDFNFDLLKPFKQYAPKLDSSAKKREWTDEQFYKQYKPAPPTHGRKRFQTTCDCCGETFEFTVDDVSHGQSEGNPSPEGEAIEKAYGKRVNVSVQRLQSFEPPEGYYLTFSGGKDSQCDYHLAVIAGVKFDAHYAITSVDPPELVRFIKLNYPDVEMAAQHYDDNKPEHYYSDGRPKPITMWSLIADHTLPPTRKVRYCCSSLKEPGGGRTHRRYRGALV